MNRNHRTILRCTGLAVIAIAALVLLPAIAQAGVPCTPGVHGVSIFKSCTSPKNRCTSDADCSDGVFCNGAEQCATEGAPGSNVVDCLITISNPITHCDSETVLEISDAILNGTGAPTTSSDLLVTASSGGTGPGCDAGSNLGGAETCTLAPGGSITVQANYYVIQVADPDPLNDQATGSVADTCDCPVEICPTGSPGCSTTPNTVQFTAATTTVSGCSPGTPVDCPDDGLFCNGTEFCDEATDGCGHQDIPNCADDGVFCNGPEFCNEESDACDSGPPVDCPSDGDACNGPEFCNEETDACDSGPDVVCDDPVCTSCNPETGACDPIDPLPAECVPSEEICRTPGFWGTHGGEEKARSQNITQELLDAFIAANGAGPEICGTEINNTDVGNVNSALEAICVAVKGDPRRQLARQLTAAALNCIISTATGDDVCTAATGDVCAGTSIAELFADCNEACATGGDLDDCIAALDCFNNGGTFDAGECTPGGEGNCHEQPLDNGGCTFQPPGPAGSSDACNEARKNDVFVPAPLP